MRADLTISVLSIPVPLRCRDYIEVNLLSSNCQLLVLSLKLLGSVASYPREVLRRGPCLWQVKCRKRDGQMAFKDAESNSAKSNSILPDVDELRKLQAASDDSVQELTTKLKKVKAKMVQVSTERLSLSTKSDVEAAESDKTIEVLAVVRGAVDLFER